MLPTFDQNLNNKFAFGFNFRMGQIGELNTFEGVNILATIGFNDQKDWFNKWVKKYQWFGIKRGNDIY